MWYSYVYCNRLITVKEKYPQINRKKDNWRSRSQKKVVISHWSLIKKKLWNVESEVAGGSSGFYSHQMQLDLKKQEWKWNICWKRLCNWLSCIPYIKIVTGNILIILPSPHSPLLSMSMTQNNRCIWKWVIVKSWKKSVQCKYLLKNTCILFTHQSPFSIEGLCFTLPEKVKAEKC